MSSSSDEDAILLEANPTSTNPSVPGTVRQNLGVESLSPLSPEQDKKIVALLASDLFRGEPENLTKTLAMFDDAETFLRRLYAENYQVLIIWPNAKQCVIDRIQGILAEKCLSSLGTAPIQVLSLQETTHQPTALGLVREHCGREQNKPENYTVVAGTTPGRIAEYKHVVFNTTQRTEPTYGALLEILLRPNEHQQRINDKNSAQACRGTGKQAAGYILPLSALGAAICWSGVFVGIAVCLPLAITLSAIAIIAAAVYFLLDRQKSAPELVLSAANGPRP